MSMFSFQMRVVIKSAIYGAIYDPLENLALRHSLMSSLRTFVRARLITFLLKSHRSTYGEKSPQNLPAV